jgi:hypothetical protein
MKKILVFSLILVLVSAAASAQARPGIGARKGQISRPEKFELRKDVSRSLILRKRAHRDGVITPFERRRIHRAKCDTRRDLTRFRHDRHRRII